MIARQPYKTQIYHLCFLLTMCLCSGSSSTFAQLPVTDLYLFQLTHDSSDQWHAHSPKFLSDFNIGGYTNQPEFINDDLLYVSVRKPQMQQNDIFSLNLLNGQIEEITATEVSEFSPSLTPDGQSFSCVRQVHGGDVDQQLFIYPLDRLLNGKSAFAEINNIGYHCWLGDDEVGLYLVTDPPRLALANTNTGTHKVYASKIGRCLRKTPGGKLAYVHKYTEDYWYLKTLDPQSADTEILTSTLEGCEDFTISSDGIYFMGMGSVLFMLDPNTGKEWREVTDLSMFGVQKITRLAINSRLQLAVVSLHE